MSTTLSSVDEILNILNVSSSEIVLSQNKNIVLFLGDTGSGKSTLAHFIGKDNRTLKSVELKAGQYLLVDDDEKISQNTTISETIIPELIEDTTTKTTFYDCPGFNDTRTTATDIANAFSIHKIINHGNAFKIILVITYHSVTSGVDRRSFIELIRNVSNIIKDVDKYKDSIAAVVMKVDNTVIKEGNNFNLVSDQEVLNCIADFLEKVKKEIPEDRPYYKNAISLIEIFRIKNQENYKRLAIFRRPMEKGPVNKITLLQNGKKSIQNILQNNIVYTKKRSNDFGYTISPESKNAIFELVIQINGNIRSIMNEIGQYIINIYKKFEKNTNDLNEQIDQFIRIQKYFLKFTQNITEQMNLVDVIVSLKIFLNKTDLQELQNLLTNLSNCNDQLQFLEKVSDNNIQTKPLEWILGFNKLIGYINDSKEWYTALSDLFTKLSTYNIQRYKHEFKMIDLYETWISEKLLKTGSDFKNIFEYFYMDDINGGNIPRSIISIENVKIVNYIKIRKLLDILIYTLESDIQYITTDPTKNQIRGNYIILSKIPSELLYSEKNFLELYAVNSVFIDKDLNLCGNKQKFVIAAPEWHIQNTVTINLNGSNIHPYARANDGEDGKPGLPGGAAGTFFGIGELFTNLKSLTITANGGTGGDGQNGGNGSCYNLR